MADVAHPAVGQRWPPTWSARWIWAGPPPVEAAGSFLEAEVPPRVTWNRWCLFRRRVEIATLPAEAWARVTADSRYVLFLNGREAARGPARARPPRLTYAEVDLSPFLREGENVIGAVVRYYGRPTPWWLPRRGSKQVGFGGFAFEAPAIGVATDRSWRALAEEGHTTGDPYQGAPDPPAAEVLDGQLWPAGWLEPSYNDTGWVEAAELRAGAWPPADGLELVNDAYPRIEADGIARLGATPVTLHRAEELAAPPSGAEGPLGAYPEPGAARPAGSGDTPVLVVLDAGRSTVGTPWVKIDAAPGTIVDLYAGEDRRADGAVEIRPRHFACRYVAAGRGVERFESFESVGMRYLGVVLRGSGRLLDAGVVERRYPRSGDAHLVADDPSVTALWEAGARTLDLCSLDTFVDCPGREQRAWVGDAYVEAMVSFVVSADTRLVRRHLHVAAQAERGDGLLAQAAGGDVELWPATIPEYSLHWVRMLARYHEHTGDSETVRELLGTAAGVLDALERFRRGDGFLAGVPGVTLIDWAWIRRDPLVAPPLDALYALASVDYAGLVAALGSDSESARRAAARAAASVAALRGLYDPSRGVLVDAPGARAVSQQLHAVALSAGVLGEAETGRALAYVLDEGRVERRPYGELRRDTTELETGEAVLAAEPFFRHFLHQAVASAGRADLILGLCRHWLPQLERHPSTFEEHWDAPVGETSRTHAWSATPTYDLTAHVLGVRPLEPGYRRAALLPSLGPLGHLAGSVPTPRGPIRVEVERGGGRLEVPDGVVVEVGGLPAGLGWSGCDLEPAECGHGVHTLRRRR